MARNLEIIKILIEYGGSITKAGLTSFLQALQYQANNEVYNKFLVDFSSLLEMMSMEMKQEIWKNDNCSIMQIAFQKNSIEVVKLLVKHGYSLSKQNE